LGDSTLNLTDEQKEAINGEIAALEFANEAEGSKKTRFSN
jgi:hypothetical protein